MYIFVLKAGLLIFVITHDGFVEVRCQDATKVNMSPTHLQTRFKDNLSPRETRVVTLSLW